MVIGDTDLVNGTGSCCPFPNADIIQFGAGITADDLTARMVPNDVEGYQLSRENSIEIAINGTDGPDQDP